MKGNEGVAGGAVSHLTGHKHLTQIYILISLISSVKPWIFMGMHLHDDFIRKREMTEIPLHNHVKKKSY